MEVERPKPAPYDEPAPRINRRKLIGMALGALLVGLASIPSLEHLAGWLVAGFMLLLLSAWLVLRVAEQLILPPEDADEPEPFPPESGIRYV